MHPHDFDIPGHSLCQSTSQRQSRTYKIVAVDFFSFRSKNLPSTWINDEIDIFRAIQVTPPRHSNSSGEEKMCTYAMSMC